MYDAVPEVLMPNFNSVFKVEVARLARREARGQTEAIRKAATQHRREIAALKRNVQDLRRKVTFLEGREKRRLAVMPSEKKAEGVRFSPKWVKADRKRLGFSAADYADLVGVSANTIYGWEAGKSKPRAAQIAAWASVRGIGRREAEKRLDLLDEA